MEKTTPEKVTLKLEAVPIVQARGSKQLKLNARPLETGIKDGLTDNIICQVVVIAVDPRLTL